MYKSPIDIIVGQIRIEQDGEIYKAVQECGITVDKKELLRALRYDRDQYDNGYAERDSEIIRCKDCKHGRPIDNTKLPEKYYKDECIVCMCEDVVGDEPMIYPPTHFCSYGKRKENTDG